MSEKLLHARYWKYDGTSPQVPNTLKYDPHGLGIHVIQTLDAMINQFNVHQYQGVSLVGAIANHHKGDSFGHQVHVAATAEQWEAAKKYWESGAFD